MSEIERVLSQYPRSQLLRTPTPLEPMPKVSAELGLNLYVKRDDLTSLGFGGNKIRQLEFYLGKAQQEGADTLLITGAVQSNFVRAAAAAAAKLGMHAVLQLEDRVSGMGSSYQQSGNVLLNKMLGASLLSYPQGEDEVGADNALHAHAALLRGQGRKPFVIPLGVNNAPLGGVREWFNAHWSAGWSASSGLSGNSFRQLCETRIAFAANAAANGGRTFGGSFTR